MKVYPRVSSRTTRNCTLAVPCPLFFACMPTSVLRLRHLVAEEHGLAFKLAEDFGRFPTVEAMDGQARTYTQSLLITPLTRPRMHRFAS